MGDSADKVIREHWGTRLGVILAVAGSAVGLGNFLRFPGLAAKYEGGAFMIPYFISLLILGIPICWCEWTLGRYGGRHGYNSAPGIFRIVLSRRWGHYVGCLALLVPVIIYMYYVYIESWCLSYAWQYATGEIINEKNVSVSLDIPGWVMPNQPLPEGTSYHDDTKRLFVKGKLSDNQKEQLLALEANPQFQKAVQDLFDVSNGTAAYGSHFEAEVGMWQDGLVSSGSGRRAVTILALVFIINFVIIYRGLNRGIETFCKYAMPVLIIAAIIILIRVLTLGTPNPAYPERNVLNGLGFMWNIHGEKPLHIALLNPGMWLEAAGQIFFSLSVGFGIIMTYSSYVRSRSDVVLSGLTASSTNEFCEVCLGGLITVPAAFIFLGPQPIQQVAGSTLGLGFYTIPAVFEFMPAGRLFGILWFFLLFLAAVTSSVSMLQPAIAFLEEGLNLKRRASVALLGLITAIGSFFVVYFSKNLMALDIMDFWVGQVLIFILGTVIVICFGWVFGIRKGWEEAHLGAHIRIPVFFKFIIKYVCPVYLLTIFFLFLIQNLISKDSLILAWIKQYSIDLWSILFNLTSKMSYIQVVWDNKSAQITLLFILVLVLFLMLLVHIAGMNWSNREQNRKKERQS